MKGKASDICTKCKHCEGLDMFAAYRCKHYNNYPDAAIGMDSEIDCCNFEIEGRANDKCQRCKHCLGMTHKGMYSCGYANDGSELNIGVNVVLNCANFEEVNMNKVEGKVGDFCLNCKNCKAVTRIHDGKNASIRIIEVDCEDPYDGMVKTLDVDSDICCSMFEMGSDLQHELEMDRLRRKIHELEKEKADHLKGIERLKKSQEKLQNQIKNLQITNEESYKREETLEIKLKNANELADSWKRDYERLRDQFVHPMCNILYPDKPDLNINLTDLLNDVKNLKVYADENGQMYKEIQEWREKCISRGNDIDHLLSENKEKDKKIGELQNIVTEKEVEIKGLRKDNVRLNKDISWGNMIAEKNTELNQTISDQGVTIKALLITIKEMCKDDETNE